MQECRAIAGNRIWGFNNNDVSQKNGEVKVAMDSRVNTVGKRGRQGMPTVSLLVRAWQLRARL
eukprot:jgi/Botrbrau1/3344/Bobra.0048s0039.1